MTKPFFSIITCTFNSERFIFENIKSVHKQTFLDYEHLFIDGDSNDFTKNIINEYKNINKKVKLYVSPANGISSALNIGAKKSKGKYIIYLNSDDSFHDRNVLKKVQKFLIMKSNVDWCYGQINVINEYNKHIGIFPKWKLLQLSNRFFLHFFNYIPHQAVFIKNEVFKKFGQFDESLRSSMDYDLWLRISSVTRYCFLPLLISNYRVHNKAESSAKKNRIITNKICLAVQKKHSIKPLWPILNLFSYIIDKYNRLYQ